MLVADEPTTLLDARNAAMISRLLGGLDEQIVVVTHQLDLVADYDRVLVIDEGRIVADGPPAQRPVPLSRPVLVLSRAMGRMRPTVIGIYHPGSSLLHRTPAWIKLILLLAAVIEISLIRDLRWLGVAAAATLLLYLVAWIPPRSRSRSCDRCSGWCRSSPGSS